MLQFYGNTGGNIKQETCWRSTAHYGACGYSCGMGRLNALRCPTCGVESPAEMPENACLYFWECLACKTIAGGGLLRHLLLRP